MSKFQVGDRVIFCAPNFNDGVGIEATVERIKETGGEYCVGVRYDQHPRLGKHARNKVCFPWKRYLTLAPPTGPEPYEEWFKQ